MSLYHSMSFMCLHTLIKLLFWFLHRKRWRFKYFVKNMELLVSTSRFNVKLEEQCRLFWYKPSMEEYVIFYTSIHFQQYKNCLNRCNVPRTSSHTLPAQTFIKQNVSSNSSCSLLVTDHTNLTIYDTIN